MKIHEYQAKDLFSKYGIPVPKNDVASSQDDVDNIAKIWSVYPAVVKAQIHAGGRGKAGGIRKVENSQEFASESKAMIGMTLVTHQTGPEGKEIKTIMIEECIDIDKEVYLSAIVDRSKEKITFIASPSGGMEIETVAEKEPEKIFTTSVHPATGLSGFHIRTLSGGLGLSKDQKKELESMIFGIYSLFIDKDATLIEINPLGVTKDGHLIACDAKINFDDNAIYRHPDVSNMRDISEEDPREYEAKEQGLSYISLTGNIGCMVNGAGLAMATMDVIKLYGGSPANFLDIGGSAKAERVSKALQIIISDKDVKGVLINIFGGIVRCDEVAKGILDGVSNIRKDIKLVIRLIGTNEDIGRKMLEDAGYPAVRSMPAAAKKIVELVK